MDVYAGFALRSLGPFTSGTQDKAETILLTSFPPECTLHAQQPVNARLRLAKREP